MLTLEPNVVGICCFAQINSAGLWTILTNHARYASGHNVITTHDCKMNEMVYAQAMPLISTRGRATALVKMWDDYLTAPKTKTTKRK